MGVYSLHVSHEIAISAVLVVYASVCCSRSQQERGWRTGLPSPRGQRGLQWRRGAPTCLRARLRGWKLGRLAGFGRDNVSCFMCSRCAALPFVVVYWVRCATCASSTRRGCRSVLTAMRENCLVIQPYLHVIFIMVGAVCKSLPPIYSIYCMFFCLPGGCTTKSCYKLVVIVETCASIIYNMQVFVSYSNPNPLLITAMWCGSRIHLVYIIRAPHLCGTYHTR